jgi:hypothetical protein
MVQLIGMNPDFSQGGFHPNLTLPTPIHTQPTHIMQSPTFYTLQLHTYQPL